jgi:hypothetical protein
MKSNSPEAWDSRHHFSLRAQLYGTDEDFWHPVVSPFTLSYPGPDDSARHVSDSIRVFLFLQAEAQPSLTPPPFMYSTLAFTR